MKFRTGALFAVVAAVTATITIGLAASAGSPPPLSGVKALASNGAGFCALLRTTQVECWGYNLQGQLGDGRYSNSAVPEKVKNLTGVVSLTTGAIGAYCAVVSGGTVSCWGGGGDNGQVGEDVIDVPAPVSGLTHVKSLTNNDSGTFCALLSTGQVRCWGQGLDGELGDGAFDNSALPVTVRGITKATQLAASQSSFCVLESTVRIYCWGYNNSSQLGDGLTNESSVPIEVENVTDPVAVTGNKYSGGYCALLATHRIYCWGDDGSGELGNGATIPHSAPTKVGGVTNAVSILGGTSDFCAQLATGRVDCWGYGEDGELGDGYSRSSSLPVPVRGITNPKVIVAGLSTYCAILTKGRVSCWGYNEYGQLGNGSTTDSDVPVLVANLTDVTTVVGENQGGATYCAVRSIGQVYCWGFGQEGQLGNGQFDMNSDVPVPVWAYNPVAPPVTA